MSLKFQIRTAHKEDLEAVIALDRKTTNAPHWAESDYRRAVEEDPGTELQRCLLLAEQESGNHRLDLIGFAVGKAIGSGAEATAELESVVVVEQARRSGVGRALCAAIIQWCRELEIPNVDLEVRSSNRGAITLYTGVGFAPVGVRKGYYRDPEEDAVLMQTAAFKRRGNGV
jgi:ribosomal-protein-alanine N-acetyltransferase